MTAEFDWETVLTGLGTSIWVSVSLPSASLGLVLKTSKKYVDPEAKIALCTLNDWNKIKNLDWFRNLLQDFCFWVRVC